MQSRAHANQQFPILATWSLTGISITFFHLSIFLHCFPLFHFHYYYFLSSFFTPSVSAALLGFHSHFWCFYPSPSLHLHPPIPPFSSLTTLSSTKNLWQHLPPFYFSLVLSILIYQPLCPSPCSSFHSFLPSLLWTSHTFITLVYSVASSYATLFTVVYCCLPSLIYSLIPTLLLPLISLSLSISASLSLSQALPSLP